MLQSFRQGSPNPALHELQGNFPILESSALICSSAGSRRFLDLLGVCKRLLRLLGHHLGEKLCLIRPQHTYLYYFAYVAQLHCRPRQLHPCLPLT